MRRTITVEDKTWRSLNTMKYSIGCDTVDDLITKLILSYNLKQKEVKKDGTNK